MGRTSEFNIGVLPLVNTLMVTGSAPVIAGCVIISVWRELDRRYVGKCHEREIEIISQLTIPKSHWLQNHIPDPLHVGSECSDEVLHWCGPEVITNNEKQEGLTGGKDPNTHQAHAGYIGSTDNK